MAAVLNDGSEDLLEFFGSIHLDAFSALRKFAEKHVGLPQWVKPLKYLYFDLFPDFGFLVRVLILLTFDWNDTPAPDNTIVNISYWYHNW